LGFAIFCLVQAVYLVEESVVDGVFFLYLFLSFCVQLLHLVELGFETGVLVTFLNQGLLYLVIFAFKVFDLVDVLEAKGGGSGTFHGFASLGGGAHSVIV
jgi:hypothetical protein